MIVSLRMSGPWLEGWGWVGAGYILEEDFGVSSGFHAAATRQGSPRALLASVGDRLSCGEGRGAGLGRCWARWAQGHWYWDMAGGMEALTVLELIRSLWSSMRLTGKGHLPPGTSAFQLTSCTVSLRPSRTYLYFIAFKWRKRWGPLKWVTHGDWADVTALLQGA